MASTPSTRRQHDGVAVWSLTDRFSQHGRVVAEKGLSEESSVHSTQVSLFFTAVRAYVFNSAGAKVVARLRVLLFGRMLAQETAWFDARETGDLLCGNQPVCRVHAIEQASRRWRRGLRDDSARTRRKILISTQAIS